MSGCIGIRLRTIRLSMEQPPARAKYAEHKRSLCDGCISLSNAEGFVRCFLHLQQLGFRFSFWAYPPSFSAHIRAYFFTNNKPIITLPVCFIPVSLPVHTPNLHNTKFRPDTILSPDSFPFVSLPTDHQLELPDILRSEILDQSISLMTIIHIFCYNCCNLIFLLSWCHSPFIYHFRRDALNQGSLLKKSFFRQSTPECTLPAFSLSAIYRCVARSCHKVIKQNLYQRKSSCIPHLSKYSCLAFSRSSSVGAVLNVVYN